MPLQCYGTHDSVTLIITFLIIIMAGDLGDRSPPVGSRSRAPVRAQEPEESYAMRLKTLTERKNNSIQTDDII